MIDYIGSLENAVPLCDEFERHIVSIANRGNKFYVLVISEAYRDYHRPIKALVDLLQVSNLKPFKKYNKSFFKAALNLEESNRMEDIDDFIRNIELIKLCLQLEMSTLSDFCSAFDEEEKERMNEAIHDCLEGCNYSCVAMSVSAVESRLLKLMCLAMPNSQQELEMKTLGQLILEYNNNKGSYKNIVPQMHEPLIGLCNTYRIFSVHPKRVNVNAREANVILNLAIKFLTDENTKPEIVKAKLAKD